MINIKIIISIIAIILTFIGYIPYISNILKGKTNPHTFSWLIWALITSIIFALQIKAGAGLVSFVTLSVGAISFFIFFLAQKNGDKNIRKVDIIFLVLALLSMPLWLVAKQPILSAILLTIIDMFGFAPTIRKSWNDPYSETLSLYVFAAVRHGLSIFALVEINIITSLFPITWVIANTLFVILLIVRRRKYKSK